MNEKQLLHYKSKLSYETDSWDVYESLNNGGNIVVVDGRSEEAYKKAYS